MRRMRICFTDVFLFFSPVFLFFSVFFSSATKYETTVLGNGWTDFHETFTKRYRGKWSFQRRTQMGARPQIIFWGLKTEKTRKIAIGAYIYELVITPERKRISERLKRLWNHKTMAYKVYVRPWPLTPKVNTVRAFACTSARFLAILSKFSAVTPRQTFTVNSPRGGLQVWKILRTLTHKRRWTIPLKNPFLHYESFVYCAMLCSSVRTGAAAWRKAQN